MVAEKGKMLLEIVAPRRQVVRSEHVDEVIAPGSEGEFGVLPGHTPFLTTLKVGQLSYREGGEWHHLACDWGYAEVGPDGANISIRHPTAPKRARRPRKLGEESAWRVNKVILVGNLGADPEVRYTNTGSAVANFRIATNERWTDKSGATQERTEWHNIVAWGKLAEICGKFLKKGRSVYVEGRLQARTWDDQAGNKRYTTEIVAQVMQMLGGRAGESQEGEWSSRPAPEEQQALPDIPVGSAASDDDLPF